MNVVNELAQKPNLMEISFVFADGDIRATLASYIIPIKSLPIKISNIDGEKFEIEYAI